MRVLRIASILACLALAQAVVASPSALEIAKRAQDAELHVSYRGQKTAWVSMNGRKSSSVIKVVHSKPNKTRKQYFSPSRLAGTIIVQSGAGIWKYVPRYRVWEEVHKDTPGPGHDTEGAFHNYNVELVGSDKVAARDAYVIRARPRHRGESAHRVWIDKASFLTLRTQTETASGAIVSSSRFTSIEINPTDISASAFSVRGRVKRITPPLAVDFRIAKPKYLPKGYKMVGVSQANANSHSCVHLQFSNGVNTISLFERKAASPAPRLPGKLSTMVTWTRAGVLFTIIGDVPRSELKRIVDSIK